MKRLLVTLIIFISIKSYGIKLDTLDFWHVYLNEKVIAKYNSASKNLTIKIEKVLITKKDTISIRYVKDTRCINCKYFLLVLDEKKRKLKLNQSKISWDKISINLKDLIDIGDKNGSKIYNFYYWEKDEKGKEIPMKLILKIKFE